MEKNPQNTNIVSIAAAELLIQTTVLQGPDGKLFTVNLPVLNPAEDLSLPVAENPAETLEPIGVVSPIMSAEVTQPPVVHNTVLAFATELEATEHGRTHSKKLRWLGAAAAGTVGVYLAQRGIQSKSVQDHAEFTARKTAGVISNIGSTVHAKARNVTASLHEKALDGKNATALYGTRRALAARKEQGAKEDVKKLRHTGKVLRRVVDGTDNTFRGIPITPGGPKRPKKVMSPKVDPYGRKGLQLVEPMLRPRTRAEKRQSRKAGYKILRMYNGQMLNQEIKERYEVQDPKAMSQEDRMKQVYADKTRRELLFEYGPEEFAERYGGGVTFSEPDKFIPTAELRDMLYLGEKRDILGNLQYRDPYDHHESVRELVKHHQASAPYGFWERRGQNVDARLGDKLDKQTNTIKQEIKTSILGNDTIGKKVEEKRRAAVQEAWMAHNKRIELDRKVVAKTASTEKAKLARSAQKIARKNARRSTP